MTNTFFSGHGHLVKTFDGEGGWPNDGLGHLGGKEIGIQLCGGRIIVLENIAVKWVELQDEEEDDDEIMQMEQEEDDEEEELEWQRAQFSVHSRGACWAGC